MQNENFHFDQDQFIDKIYTNCYTNKKLENSKFITTSRQKAKML